MKIIYITYNLSSGGAERLVVDLTNELSSNQDDEVHLLTIRTDDCEENTFYKKDINNNIKYHNLAINTGFNFKDIVLLYYFLKKIKPEIVHFHGVNIVLYFILSILFYRKPKYIETLHSTADNIITFKNFSFVTIPIYKLRLVRLVAISHANYNTIRKKLKTKKIPIIYNGRAINNLNTAKNIAFPEIDRYKENSGELIFIHVGRCSEEKNQQLMIEAFNNVSVKYPNSRLFIFGDGYNSELGNYLRSIAGKNIHFMGSKNNILDYMNYSDAFLLSSRFEGMPITLIEALATNTVPICTPTSGVIDVIKNGVNGFISEDFTLQAYQNSLQEYFESDLLEFKKEMSNTYNNYFTIDGCAKKYHSLYTKI